MVKKRGRPIDPKINCDFFPCVRCDHLLEKDKYGIGPGGKRYRICPTCREKDEKKKIEKIQYDTEQFDLNRIKSALKTNSGDKTGTTICMFGQSKVSGKTTLLKKIIEETHDNFDFIILFTVNTQAPVYKDLEKMNNVRICFRFEPKIVNLFHKINSEINIKERLSVLFVLDDEIDSKLNNTLRNMILTYRNMNISTVICSQSYSLVDKKSRGNFNFIFLGKFSSDEHIRDIVNIYLSSMVDIDVGKKRGTNMITNFYREKTQNHHFLVIDGTEDDFKVRIYKANI